MKITVFYVGASLLSPLRKAEPEINSLYNLDLHVAAYNCGAPLPLSEWQLAERDLTESEIIFIVHVTDQENAARIVSFLDNNRSRNQTVIAFNCMPDLMRRTHMGKLDFASLMKSRAKTDSEGSSQSLARKLGHWMADTIKGRKANGTDQGNGDNKKKKRSNHVNYVKLISKMPAILRFVPSAGRLRDIKNYLFLFSYFLQPTPANIRSMLLYAIKNYVANQKRKIDVDEPEHAPAVAIYHPEAEQLFQSFDDYRKWYELSRGGSLDSQKTIGLLLMRPQIVSGARHHYDGLIKAIEAEGLGVIPALSTLMDNRDACGEFFIEKNGKGNNSDHTSSTSGERSRVSQIVSLTGFSFVGGPAMNDSEAAAEFFRGIKTPFRSMVSLDIQTIEDWQHSRLGLNPIQTAMQVAIPEIDGAIEPFVFGGMPQRGFQPEPLEERCKKIARRLARWNRLQTVPRKDLRLAFVIFCFPPNKGNIGTAADLDVFPSLMEILAGLKSEGYSVEVPSTVDHLRSIVLEGNSADYGQIANVAYRMKTDEYRSLCPFVSDIEKEWGRAPGTINSNGRELFVHGAEFGNALIAVQPTFGYEGDPMRMLASESGSPHHGFMALYTYIEKIFRADAIIHVGTHGSLEFMPGKQAGLSSSCWPDRLIGELPNVYIYSVNNPSEGTIARRRSYAGLVSYLTPPIQNAGLYKELSSLKELIDSYRRSTSEKEREQLFEAIEEQRQALNL
jgi:magnesium chelatase subunit H